MRGQLPRSTHTSPPTHLYHPFRHPFRTISAALTLKKNRRLSNAHGTCLNYNYTIMSNLKLPTAPNAGLFKQGYQTSNAEDGAVQRNIQACREITGMVRTSIGPCGRNKIVVNHLGRIFLTSDAATILRELEVIHPAAKLLVQASQQQELECGDATNLVLTLAGSLLNKADELIRIGLHPSEVVQGYERAKGLALMELETIAAETTANAELANGDTAQALVTSQLLARAVKTAVASKQYGHEAIISRLVTEAVQHVMPKNIKAFNVDAIRVVKIMGASLGASQVIKGMVFNREPESTVKNCGKAKVVVFSTPVDISSTETKGTVLLKSAQEMLNFSKGEEAQVETMVKNIADSGVKVVVCGAGLGDLPLHYMNRMGLIALKVPSKFDLRRLCRVVGATPLARVGAPLPEEMGTVDVVETIEIGGDRVTVLRQEDEATRTATVVVRGATQNALDDVERAIDDGVSVVKSISKDPRLVPGAGATEIRLVSTIVQQGERTQGLMQHAIKAYGQAFEVLPETLAENAGLDAIEVLARLYAAHSEGRNTTGVDVDDNDSTGTCDASAADIFDSYSAKMSAIELATDVANTILTVDQIIMAKRAGGPTMPKQQSIGNWDQDD